MSAPGTERKFANRFKAVLNITNVAGYESMESELSLFASLLTR